MIELAAGRKAATEAAVMAAGGRIGGAALGVLLLAFGLLTLPAAIGLLALLGALR